MKKAVILYLISLICLCSFGQTDSSDFKIIDLQSNDLEKVVTIRQALPSIKYNVKVQDRKLYQQAINITVDSIIDTITVTRGVSDFQIIATYFNPNHWYVDVSTPSREKEKNVGFLKLKTKEDWSCSAQSYIYFPKDKRLIYNYHPDLYFFTVRWDGWLIFGHIIMLIGFLMILSLFVINIIEKRLNKKEKFVNRLFNMDPESFVLLILLLIISGIIIACHHLWSLIIWLALYIIFFVLPLVLPVWMKKIKKYLTHKGRRRKRSQKTDYLDDVIHHRLCP